MPVNLLHNQSHWVLSDDWRDITKNLSYGETTGFSWPAHSAQILCAFCHGPIPYYYLTTAFFALPITVDWHLHLVYLTTNFFFPVDFMGNHGQCRISQQLQQSWTTLFFMVSVKSAKPLFRVVSRDLPISTQNQSWLKQLPYITPVTWSVNLLSPLIA